MSKGNRNREQRRRETQRPRTINIDWPQISFCLPDTPDNREWAEEMTGTPAACLINKSGMLDSSLRQKNTAISSHQLDTTVSV